MSNLGESGGVVIRDHKGSMQVAFKGLVLGDMVGYQLEFTVGVGVGDWNEISEMECGCIRLNKPIARIVFSDTN